MDRVTPQGSLRRRADAQSLKRSARAHEPIVEKLAVCLQASLLLRHSTPAVADAFCASRLGGDWGQAFGTLNASVPFAGIIARAWGEAG